MPQHGWAQCRFCLEDVPVEDLIAPCRCVGTGRYVHEDCLKRWQEELGRKTSIDERAAVCQSCKSPFSVQPAVLLRPLPRPMLFTRPIFEHISTNPFFDSNAARSLPTALCRQLHRCMSPGCLVLQEPTAVESIIRREHWHQGVFLIGGVWPGLGHASSDALIGVNLAGARLSAAVARRLDQGLLDFEAYLRSSSSVTLSHVTGGPVQPRSVLVLVSFLGRLGQSVSSRVRLVLPCNVDSTAPELTTDASDVPRTPQRWCSGALFGEPHDVLHALHNNEGLDLVGAVAFQGHAVWSSTQLVAEIARGSWGLAQAEDEDLAVIAPLKERDALWSQLWNTRPLLRGGSANTCDSAPPSGCHCVVS